MPFCCGVEILLRHNPAGAGTVVLVDRCFRRKENTGGCINGQAAGNVNLIHYYRPIPEAQMDACTNVVASPATQESNGVMKYSSTVEGFWQNPGY